MCLAIPGRIVALDAVPADPLFRTARVDFGGVVKEVSLACVPDATIGDYVLVHAGLALTQLDESAAQQLLQEIAALAPDSEELL
ncbi:MAG: HypC/HybG/HupF family hydrogenase formation chaperone [Planctomycetota bacterium]